LEVLVVSEIEINSPTYWPLQLNNSPAWEESVDFLKSVDCSIEVQQFQLETELTAGFPAIKQYTLQSFSPGRPLLEAVQALNSRIYHDFTFSPGFTDVSTPVEQVFIHKKGVCQDFAHLFLSCLRSLGLAARYVSGYIETLPPPGKVKLTGSDASHAWVSVYCPRYGWVDFDATNNLINHDRHLTIAWGRDFTDVIPMKGIVYSSGSQKLVVEVDVIRQKDK
jgi:transglutaminase-like putative cysteine protease